MSLVNTYLEKKSHRDTKSLWDALLSPRSAARHCSLIVHVARVHVTVGAGRVGLAVEPAVAGVVPCCPLPVGPADHQELGPVATPHLYVGRGGRRVVHRHVAATIVPLVSQGRGRSWRSCHQDTHDDRHQRDGTNTKSIHDSHPYPSEGSSRSSLNYPRVA